MSAATWIGETVPYACAQTVTVSPAFAFETAPEMCVVWP